MYKIIGADGKEYGPITSEQLRQWLAEGRANAQTKVLAEGTTEWRMLSELPEFASAVPTAAAPAAIPTMQPVGVSTSDAAQRVSGPAIGLIVTAVLGFVLNIIGIIWQSVMGMAAPPSGMNPQVERMIKAYQSMGIVNAIIVLLMSALVFFGALKMKKLESYGLAMTASILAMIPCISPCCIVGLPIGIWALVVLSKPEVKSAFH